MRSNKNSSMGFTIVELLIVIVVIAILAAITIVAFNGIQNRAKASSAQSAASIVAKKAEAANAITSGYPTTATGTGAGSFGENNDSSLTGAGLSLAAISAAPTNPNTVEYQKCTAGATGARVAYWDYSAAAKSAYNNLGTVTGCTTWSTVTGGPF